MEDAVTVTAADLLDRPGEPGNARIMKIADFTALKEPLSHWRDHLALWAVSRRPGSKYGRRSLPVPQTETAEGPRWSRPVARDWAEEHHRAHGPQALLSGTTVFGSAARSRC